MNKDILYRFFEGKTTYEEEKDIRSWMELSKENYDLYLKERKIFDTVNLLEYKEERNIKRNTNRTKSLFFEILKIASIALLTFILSFLYFSRTDQDKTVMQSLYVPAGQRVNITLSDGTKVWLNARTKIEYPSVFDKKNRRVRIDGEAYFSVSKDMKRPFIVETDKCDMEVLGTEFNVEAHSNKEKFEIALMKGSVKVLSKSENGNSLILLPDHKASLKGDGQLIISNVEDYNVYRWKEGLICFKSESFKSIMEDLEQYFGTKIIVNNNKILSSKFTGKFRQSDGLDYALRVLQRDISFKYERDDENQIIYIK